MEDFLLKNAPELLVYTENPNFLKLIKEELGINLKGRKNLTKIELEKVKKFVKDNEKIINAFIKEDTIKTNIRQTKNKDTEDTLFNKIFPDVLAFVTISSAFLLFYLLVSGSVNKNEKDIALYILGVLSNAVASIFSHYYQGGAVFKQQKK